MMVGVLWCPNERKVLAVAVGDYPLFGHWREVRYEYFPDANPPHWMRGGGRNNGMMNQISEQHVPNEVRLAAMLGG